MILDEALKQITQTCGDGWLPLVIEVFQACPEGITITEAFQKYGALEFRIEPENKEFEDYLDHIGELSRNTCQICGQEGASEKTVTGWIETICENRQCIEKAKTLVF